MTVAALIGLAGTVLGAGGLAALFQARSLSHKTDAEAEVTLGGGWETLVETIRRDNLELRERVAIVEHREAECRDRLAQLEGGSMSSTAVLSLIDEAIAKREATKSA